MEKKRVIWNILSLSSRSGTKLGHVAFARGHSVHQSRTTLVCSADVQQPWQQLGVYLPAGTDLMSISA